MKFTVESPPWVDAALANLFLETSDRKAVTAAADWIERQLQDDPFDKVTPVDDLYFLRRDTLVVLCEIKPEDRLVTIVEIHRVPAK